MLRNSLLQHWIDMIKADPLDGIIMLVIELTAIVFAVILHEISHGYAALWCGDPTAKMLGRLSLNPSHHLDPVGSLMLVTLGFGFARPVPVNPNNFKNDRRDYFLVSIAGIVMNFCLFLASAFLMTLVSRGITLRITSDITQYYQPNVGTQALSYVFTFFYTFASLNLRLALFNLLPIPPLDGYHIVNDVILRGRLRLKPEIMRICQIVLFVLVLGTTVVSSLLNTVGNAIWNPVMRFFQSLF